MRPAVHQHLRPSYKNWSTELFERFTVAVTVVNLARQGNMEKLQKLIRGGCRIDRRTTYDPWMTPLDAAAIVGNAACADLLLSSGAPLAGSSIFEAIRVDSRPVLEVFHRHDAFFFRNFLKDKDGSENPRLNRWLLHFTALDYALSVGATACSRFLTEVGAPKKKKSIKCYRGHYAPLIEDQSFLSFRGVNTDELCKGRCPAHS
jgi:ankyrin repeat protein